MKLTSLHIPVQIFPDFTTLDLSGCGTSGSCPEATGHAYAPYSNFRVGAAIRLSDGQIITGSNQENASFPAGICAESVALSAASAIFPGIAITSLALTYINELAISNQPD